MEGRHTYTSFVICVFIEIVFVALNLHMVKPIAFNVRGGRKEGDALFKANIPAFVIVTASFRLRTKRTSKFRY